MCRYAEYGPYKSNDACFDCRKAFKRTNEEEWPAHLQLGDSEQVPAPCPQCGKPMADLGLDFKPPPRKDIEHWRVVEFLFRHGVGYHSCGCGGPGYRPSRWRDMRPFLESHRCRSAGEALLAKVDSQPRRRASARAGR